MKRLPKSWDRRALLLTLLLVGCGSSNPASPTPPPSAAALSVAGTLAGFYDASKRFSGSTATLATVPPKTATVTADGSFQFADVSAGTYTLSFAGPDHIDRAVSVQVIAGGANDLGTIDAVERAVGEFQFNLQMFNEMARTSYPWDRSAVTMVRTRDRSSGTVGKPIPCANTPSSKSRSESFMASAPDPAMTGVMGVSDVPVSKPRRSRPALKKRLFSQSRSMSSGSDASTSIAARQAAATAGGCEVENRNGRALCSSVVRSTAGPAT